MSRKERERLVVFGQVKARSMSRREAAEVLGISLRQIHRLYRRWRDGGEAALVHRGRGKASPRRLGVAERDKAIAHFRDRYRGYGPTLFAEKLGEHHGIWVSHDTALRWLREAGLMERGRRGRRSRQRRKRRERFGEMVQMDGSLHAWFGEDFPACVLMTVIDDATGKRRGRFFPAETLAGAFEAFGDWCRRYGVPESLYVDRHGIYRSDRDPTAEEVKAGRRPVTQFGRAMEELNVTLILARSPQAKGRVERSNGVLQDRLLKELVLAKVTSSAAANVWLESSCFFEKLDKKFAVEAVNETDAHRPVVSKLGEVLCLKEKRSVGLDGCVQWEGRVLQLESPGRLKGVQVWELADGGLIMHGDGKRLSCKEITPAARKASQATRALAKRGPIRNNKSWKPNARQKITISGKAGSQNLKPGATNAPAGLRKTG